jgi:hypothetical protein
MKMIDLDLNPDRARLRQFGLIALVAFGLLGGWAIWKHHFLLWELESSSADVAIALWVIAGVSGLFSLIWPTGNRGLYVLLTCIAYPIGTVVSYVLMAILFYVVIAPVGLWFRLIGRDALHRKIDRDASTYWTDHLAPKTVERYFKQF